MNTTLHTARLGLRRGVVEVGIKFRSPAEFGYTLLGIAALAVVLVMFRDTPIEGTGIPMAGYILAAALAVQVTLITGWGAATELATEYEDGTLLRARALPHGIRAYVLGAVTRMTIELVATTGVAVALAAIILGPGLGLEPLGAALLLAVVALATAAIAPIAVIVAALVRNPRIVGGWGLLLSAALVVLSGLFQPLASMPGWLHVIGQSTPVYWLGLGLRTVFLPDEAAIIEIGADHRTGWVLLVLVAWAVAGAALAPLVLGRVVRQESGSRVAARRDAALGRI